MMPNSFNGGMQMNIIDALGENFDYFQFKYFGLKDMATNFDVNLIIEKSKIILDYFDKDISNISTIDDFIDCLFIEKYSKFSEVVSFLNDDYKAPFSELVKFFIEKKNTIKPVSYIRFINERYKDILKLENFSLHDELFDMSFKYSGGCEVVIKHLIEENFHMILDNLEKIQKVLFSKKEFIDLILQKKHFENIKHYRLNEYFELIKFCIDKKIETVAVEELIKLIVLYGQNTLNLINEDNAIQYKHIFIQITEFLKEIKHKKATEFEAQIEYLSNLMDEYLKKHGHSFSYKIPYDEMIKPFENPLIHWQTKMFMLTHIKNKDTGSLESYHTVIGRDTKQQIMDHIATSNIPTDSYFFVTKQQTLNLYDHSFLLILQYYVNKDKIQEFVSMLASLTTFIFENYNIDFKKSEMGEDLNIILNLFLSLFEAEKNKNMYLKTGLNYSLIMFMCGVIEKFLRLIHKEVNKEIYMSNDWYSLGNLLDVGEKSMVELLGEHEIRVVSYYLSNGKNMKIGHNFRNNFAHYKNIKIKDIDYGVTLKTLNIFLTIVNTISIKVLEKQRTEEKTTAKDEKL